MAKTLPVQERRLTVTRVTQWIQRHDESWLFVAMYIGFAVVLSVWLSLFWLVLMVGIHFLFEMIRHSQSRKSWLSLLSIASWEIRLDVALVLLAFAVALYMDAIMGIVGLQSAGRAAVATSTASRVGTRAVAWQRMVRAVVLGFDDVANAIRAIFMRKRGAEEGLPAAVDAVAAPAAATAAADPSPDSDTGGPAVAASNPTASPIGRLPGWGDRWSFWDRLTLGLMGACVIAMVMAPPLTGSTYEEGLETLRQELQPFPGDAHGTGRELETVAHRAHGASWFTGEVIVRVQPW